MFLFPQGGTLFSRIADARARRQFFKEEEVEAWMMSLAEGLDYIHSSVC